MDKKALRREIGAKKRALTPEQIENRSAILADKLYKSPQYRDCTSLYAYLSFNQEVRTNPIIERAWADGKRVAVPKVVGDEMIFIWIDSFENMAPQGAYGITEPIENGPVADDETALILMPGLAFDPRRASRGLRRRILRPLPGRTAESPHRGAVLRFPAVRTSGRGRLRRAGGCGNH